MGGRSCVHVPRRNAQDMQEGAIPGTVGDQLDRFLDDLAIAGRSPATVKMYGVKLRAKLPLDLPVYELTGAVCRELVVNELRLNQQSTAHTFHAILRSFTGYLEREGLLAVNPMARVPKPKLPEPQTKALSQEALARLWQAACELDSEAAREGGSLPGAVVANPTVRFRLRPCETTEIVPATPDSTTYRLLFAMLRDTGLRRAEVAGARYDDIEGDVLRVLGKGRKYRRVLLTPEVLGLLGALDRASEMQSSSSLTNPYTGRRSAEPTPARFNPTTRGPIFGVSPSRIGQLFAQIARRAGVKATAHSMRHSWATEFLRSGGQMEAARILGGWSDMRQLATRYAAGVVEEAALMEARRLAQQSRPEERLR